MLRFATAQSPNKNQSQCLKPMSQSPQQPAQASLLSPEQAPLQLSPEKAAKAAEKANQKANKADQVTPMMAQFLAIKEDHGDALLFYRMGDFYEMFFEDAEKAARALDITLTKRGKHQGRDIPMCGVPVHSHEQYLLRLIRKGYRVAVCEQTEDPAEAKKRGAKSVVSRAVVRVVTPGTITEDALLDARSNNYLAALGEAGGALGMAWLDVSTGAFFVEAVEKASLGAVVARLNPGELLVSDGLLAQDTVRLTLDDWCDVLTPLAAQRFDSASSLKRLQALFKVQTLDAFGDFSRAEAAACGALVAYVELTQKGKLPRIEAPRQIKSGGVMEIDAATRRNLELTETMQGARKGSLLSVIDRTITGAGARLLHRRLSSPLAVCETIEARLDEVEGFVSADGLRQDLRDGLKATPDLERALSRLSLGRGGPRDLAAISGALKMTAQIRTRFDSETQPKATMGHLVDLGRHGELVGLLQSALDADLPVLARDGGFVRAGFRADLDKLKTLRDESRRLIASLQGRYRDETGITALKVKHNNVLGYFIEVPSRHGEKMLGEPDSPFIHRQTMAGAVRFSTVELGELAGKIARAAEQTLALELEIFADLCARTLEDMDAIALAARALARLDVASSLAQLAVENKYVRPEISDGLEFEIEGGRHPVVEAALIAGEGERFVANDCHLDETHGKLWLLTGPNMAGKSTYLRQNALIAILAQMGGFVPADRAHIGLVDRLFSRVGAADDLARGRSTFMVEMVETAAILNQAGKRALVILDEIGRGTSTFDGLSIAWAVIEHLDAVNQCRTLFATHYHELTGLAKTLDGLSCHAMQVKEWKGDVVFLHQVGPGAADRSYGIHVGSLAGLPGTVVARAEAILKTLEAGEQSSALTELAGALAQFNAEDAEISPTPERSAVEEALAAVHTDEMSPKEALEFLYRLKRLAQEDET